jgi:glycosyltransferase involved in cell wall biosynthesis
MIGLTSQVEMPRQIAQLGHKVYLVVGSPPSAILRRSDLIPQARVIYLPMLNHPFLTTLSFQSLLVLLLPFCLLRSAPDAVIVDYFSTFSIIPWVLLRRLGLLRTSFILDLRTLPVDVKGWHGWISNRRFDWSLEFAKQFMDGITMITPKMRDDLSTRFGIPPEGIGVWESGVNVEKFQAARSHRNELGWADKFVVLYHGTLSPNRGLQATVAAFAELRPEYPDVLLCLLGAGAAKAELEALVRQLGLEQVVVIHPPVPYAEIPDHIASADVGIIPLPDIEWWNTSSPLKLMEYLAVGKPVIVSRIAAHTAVLRECECAFYLQYVSPVSIAEGILHFYQRKQDLARWGNMGRDLVRERFSWKRQAERLLDYIFTRIADQSMGVENG